MTRRYNLKNKPKTEKPAKSKADRKQAADDGPLTGIGHNLKKVKTAIIPFAARYNNLLDAKESNAAEYMADVKALLEEAANDLGCPRKLVRQALQDQRRHKKQAAKDSELEPQERNQLETLRDALGLFSDTPLGLAAAKSEMASNSSEEADGGNGKVVAISPKRELDSGGTYDDLDEVPPSGA